MKTIISSIFLTLFTALFLTLFMALFLNSSFAQQIPADSLYLSAPRPGYTPVIFPLQSTSGLRPVERISITTDGKEIYYSELNGWPPSNSRVKCYKYTSTGWQGPFVVFEGFVAPGLSMNDSVLYMQRDTMNVSWSYYSRRTSSGWSAPVKLLSTSLQTHYFQETLAKNYYLASTPGGNSDICKLSINNNDTAIVSLGKPINNNETENDFFVSRDESFLIFFRLSSPFNLFISYHKSNGKWTNPKSLGPNINTNIYECCPFVTRDNKYLFFTRGGSAMPSYYTYWVKIDNTIDSLKHTNFFPYLNNQIPDQTDTAGRPFTYTVPDSMFVDDDGNNTLTYSASLNTGNPLPSWLSFNPSTRTLSGTPPSASSIGLKVTVTDTAGATAYCNFYLNVINTSIREINGQEVTGYKLFQNYPNPFNPGTVIRYSLLKSSSVSLKVYDITGKQIASLVNARQNQGLYEVTLDMNSLNLSSGIYFYVLNVAESNTNTVYKETKVMNYIK